jgi:urease accessory protein
MTAQQVIHHQRSEGEIVLAVERHGLTRMREAGAAKVRFPQGGREAMLINTGGGLAGGDRFDYSISAGDGALLTVTTQAAERVYRSLGPSAAVQTTLKASDNATLFWLPQELILFDGAALNRLLHADLAVSATFLAVESVVFGRMEMGEGIHLVRLRDRWRIRREGRAVFADDLVINGALPATAATFGEARAMATLVLVASDAEIRLDAARAAIAGAGGASAWDGKLVARILARDGFGLRKFLIPLLHALAGAAVLPKVWSL